MQRGLSSLLDEAQRWFNLVLPRAHTPYSNEPVAALLLLSDGAWVPGVRVESASYSLLIPALLNAYTTMHALGRTDVAALFMSRPLTEEERVLSQHILPGGSEDPSGQMVTAASLTEGFDNSPLSPMLDAPLPSSPREGIAGAQQLLSRAHTPESNFQVACLMQTEDGLLIPGVNVEHRDWSQILCAERNAVGTAISYGLTTRCTLYLTCGQLPGCTPCGACRQLLAELTPHAQLWIDLGENAPPKSYQPHDLLPDMFSGEVLIQRPNSLDAI